MTSKLLAAVVAPMTVALSLASSLTPAVAAPREGIEGTWGQWMTCRTHDNTIKFFNKIKIYRNREGLRFVGAAPLPKISDSPRDELFAGNYYGAAQLEGDTLTLRVSDRYRRDYQDPRFFRYGTMVAQDARYRVTPTGELIADGQPIGMTQGDCQGTPLKKG